MVRTRTVAIAIEAVLVVACGGPGSATPSTASPSASAGSPVPQEASTQPSVGTWSPKPSQAGVPVVVVTCDGPSASVSATAVRAQPDGVHIEAIRTDGSPATVDVGTAENGWIVTTEGAAALVLAPGRYELTCLDPSATEGTRATVVVADPDDLWTPGEIECDGGSGTTGSGDAAPAAPDEAIDHLRSIVLSFRPDDILEPAGYPAAPSGWIRLVRDGRVMAAWYVTGGGEAIGFGSMIHCPGADIAYREPA